VITFDFDESAFLKQNLRLTVKNYLKITVKKYLKNNGQKIFEK